MVDATTKYSPKSHIFQQESSRKKTRNVSLAIFYFSILSQGNLKMLVNIVYRTVPSHLWTEIFPKIAFFGLKVADIRTQKNRFFFAEKVAERKYGMVLYANFNFSFLSQGSLKC